MRRLLVFLLCFTSLFLSSLGFATERQPNADYRARREALAAKAEGGAVVLFAPTEKEGPNDIYGFRQEDNFYYLTGLKEPGAGLIILPARAASEGATSLGYTEILLLPARNVSQEKWTGPKLTAETPDVKQQTGFDQVMSLDAARDVLNKLLPTQKLTVYTDTDVDSGSAGPMAWLRRANAFPVGAGFRDVKPLLAALRVKKDAGEISLEQKAVDASLASHFAAMKAMKPGMKEQEISALMQYEFEKRGCERPAYAPIVGSGFYSTVLHYSEDEHTIHDGDVVVLDVAGEYSMYAADITLDVAGEYSMYAADITRTLPANGHFTARQREIYDIVLGAQTAAADAFKTGVSTIRGKNSLYQVAMDYINAHGKDLHGQPLGKYFIHGLSHYIGLNVHDVGDTTTPLEPGMMFTIEPGIYIPEEKIGVRIEDDYLVGADGKLVKMSAALPSKAEDVEKLMAAH